jgi:uroporphyrinogen decarboxylase
MSIQETMTPRERVLAALNHEEPDRVPMDLGGFQTGIHLKAYQALLDHLGLKEELQTLDPVQQLATPSERVLDRFHIDIRYLTARAPAGFDGRIQQNLRGGRMWHDLRDEFGVVWSMPEDQGLYMDISHHPLARAGIRDVERYPFPDGGDPTRFAGLRERALKMRQETPFALSSGICGVTYEVCWYMRGLEQWFVDMIENPAFCEALIDRTCQFWVDWLARFLAEVGDLLDIIMIGDDLTGQDGPLFSPAFYRRVVKPRQRRIVDTIRRLTGAKIWYHTCGSCMEYIPDLIENGIDILNPVQISARNMNPESLKRRFGRNLVFWGGGIDAQHILPFASPERVRQEVEANVRAFKPGGGYIFCNCHNIQAGVPPENIVALYDAAYDASFYKGA